MTAAITTNRGCRVTSVANPCHDISTTAPVATTAPVGWPVGEPPTGDALRHEPPFWRDEPHVEGGALHLHLNAGKRSVTLDLQTEADRATLRRLIDTADAVLEDFAPGTLDALGLGYEALAAERGDLVMVSVTPFGQTGPFASWKATELISYAAGATRT